MCVSEHIISSRGLFSLAVYSLSCFVSSRGFFSLALCFLSRFVSSRGLFPFLIIALSGPFIALSGPFGAHPSVRPPRDSDETTLFIRLTPSPLPVVICNMQLPVFSQS